MKLTILGCGTSGGVPRVDGFWGAADPTNPKNRRKRASVMVEEGDTTLLIDTSPDLREQLLTNNVSKIDAVLYTHDHADHTHGIDDLRFLAFSMGQKIPIYGNQETLDILKQRFGYIFESKDGYPAICDAHLIEKQKNFGTISVTKFDQRHGNNISLGYRFGDIAYSTDLNQLTDEAIEALKGVKVWVVDALRYEPHQTHSHVSQTLEWIDLIKPERAILTHMAWEIDYETLKSECPSNVEPAYDGLQIEI